MKRKNGVVISEEMLRDMARFFLKELFYGIPEIPVSYGDPDKEEISCDAAGEFRLEKCQGYDVSGDSLFNTPGYRWRYKAMWEGYPEFGGVDFGVFEGLWENPLNHPEAYIVIRRCQARDALRLTGTLLHELLHYYCWYIGLDHHDGDRDFEDLCREMGLSSNFRDWVWKDGKWKSVFDYSHVEEYLRMYVEHLLEERDVA